MSRIDETRPFIPVRIAVLTVSGLAQAQTAPRVPVQVQAQTLLLTQRPGRGPT